MNGVATLADVEAIEATGLPPDLPRSPYEMLQRGAAIDPGAPALSFFLRVAEHRNPERWTYAQLLARITQAAALPKRIQIVQQLPALKRLEVEDVLRGALRDAGVELLQLEVDDGARGTQVRAVLRDRTQEATAQAVLGRYPFAFSCAN